MTRPALHIRSVSAKPSRIARARSLLAKATQGLSRRGALFVLAIATLAFVSPASAQDRSNAATARLAAQICLDIYANRPSEAALQAGFRQARRGYVRAASGLTLTGHSDQAEVLVTGRFRTCTYDYRSDQGARAAVDAYVGQLRTMGLTEGTARGLPAFQIGGVWHTVYGSSGSQNGTRRTLIALERVR